MVTKVSTTEKKPKDLKANTTSISLEISWNLIHKTSRHQTPFQPVGKAILVLVKGEETLLMPERGINLNQGSTQT